MNYFEEASLRLKQELGCKMDKEVAGLLGLSPVAWVGRKKRNNFPETELYALAAKRPELAIDVNYVLTGQRATEPKANQPLEAETVESLNTALGERLREERLRIGLSQTGLAEKLGVSLRSQQNYEAGKRIPDASYLAALAAAGVDVLYVLNGQKLTVNNFSPVEGYPMPAMAPGLTTDVNCIPTTLRDTERKTADSSVNKMIGERVKQVRGALNQRQFAEQLGVSLGSVSQIEQGKAMPSGEFLVRIHAAFGVDVTWLLTGQEAADNLQAKCSQTSGRHADLCRLLDDCSDESLDLIQATTLRLRAADMYKKQYQR